MSHVQRSRVKNVTKRASRPPPPRSNVTVHGTKSGGQTLSGTTPLQKQLARKAGRTRKVSNDELRGRSTEAAMSRMERDKTEARERQTLQRATEASEEQERIEIERKQLREREGVAAEYARRYEGAVSYTHLTLPTKRIV
eukprot:TRINITY_DN44380_c0_g1_i1.p1 TRINITY_DN44380_c0_g1~~TRINITY_DN44380_c0_g1_i1.p1  ORF type:complete len:140 (-),score=28.80 TRINITY_DN44380_c0_g1_i1:103-522(-)